jgi:CRISPR/Cas system-associated exonuclease Cas4 (RecB family)
MTGTTHRATQENGPSVVNHTLLWTSASGITTADPNSYGGCNRRWWYEKVGGKEAPTTAAMTGGTALHSEVESRLRTGSSLQTPLALAGGMFVPQPGNGLLVEQPIHFLTRNSVHIFGHVDLYNLRQQYIDPEGVLQQDPPWSFETKDWKTTSSFEYAKSERELGDNIQLNTYGKAGFLAWPDMEHGRFTHVYFLTRGTPKSKLVTIRRTREQIETRWEYAEAVVRSMSDITRETSAERVEPNLKSCSAYRGCPHRDYCSAAGKTSLDALYNKIATDFQTKDSTMGLLASNPQIMQTAPAQQQAAQPQPDMRQQLAAEEAQMRQQVVQQQAPQLSLIDAWARIEKHGRGFPALGGKAAFEMGTARGYQMSGNQGFAGAGALAGIQLMEPAHVFQLLAELDGQAPQQPAPAPQPVVQQYVQQTPAVPPQAQPNFTQQVAQAYTQQTGQPINFLPPGAPESMPQLAAVMPKDVAPAQYVMQTPVEVVAHQNTFTAPAVVQSPPEEAKPKAPRGRPKKDKSQDATPEVTAAVAAPTANTPLPVGTPAPQAPPVMASASESGTEMKVQAQYGQPTIVLVNARRAGATSKSLADYVDYINAELAKRYSVNDDGSPGIQDVRCAPKNSPLAFGGWKGAVREVVKSGVGLDGLEGTTLHLDTFMDELNEAVADALRVVADQRGWIYIRAVR